MTNETETHDEPDALDEYDAEASDEAGQAPVQKLRHGPITAAIWRNESEEGLPYYAVTLSRSYRDESGQWRDAYSFSGLYVLAAARLLERADDRIQHLRELDRRQQRTVANAANGRSGR